MKSETAPQYTRNMRQNASVSTILVCLTCGAVKPKKRRWQVFCSPKCRKAAWLLNHRTGTYTDIRQEIIQLGRKLDIIIERLEKTMGIKEGGK